MALQIANPSVVAKVDRLARALGVTKTAAVEQAVDELLREVGAAQGPSRRIEALLDQLDRIPARIGAPDPLDWDDTGLPK